MVSALVTAPYGAPELGPAAARQSLSSAEETAAQQRQLQRDIEAGLWRRHIEQQDAEARERIIMLHLPYARVIATGLFCRHGYHGIEFAEYLQLATLGLIEAVDRYDPTRGAQFRTYAHRRMQGTIHDGLEHISEQQEQLALKRRLVAERIAAAKAALPAGKLHDGPALMEDMAEVAVGLMLGFMLDGTGMYQDDTAGIPDGGYRALCFKQERQRVLDLLGQLTQREQSVIRLHYLQGLPFESIARSLALTKGRISQLHEQALRKLRLLLGA
ncbi:sigma-70 family RNA polymerase sigma factor [Xylophilus rhododendri]|uniref:Sigma-70 family RNA polymerase sigma factor n=1 Tax=Xylophilus rhododendri TaxID=2697032 RepID=A0A857J8Q2_9BURK|nr:sigma-70 family RNA polymerase sigma factor [Xylophilus rhododendri]QHI99155.1 sigma-70 family RNA polymerase sigma factor [Xylophilus rhododendri]